MIKSALIQNSRYGLKNRCLEFDGTDDYVSVTGDGSISTGQVTHEAWVKLDRITGISMWITNRLNTYPATFALRCAIINDNVFVFGNAILRLAGSESTANQINSDAAFSINTWTHIAATYDGTTFKLYVNGALQSGSLAVSGNIDTSNYTSLTIGTHPTYVNNIDGYIDEVRIWNHARTADQIKRYMHTRLYGTETGLVAYYPMNEGTGDVVNDKSQNSNHGTRVGATWIKP